MRIDELRGLSSTLFGHRYRLELLAALMVVREGEGICLTVLARRFEVSPSVYQPPVQAFVAAGLVRREGRTKTDPRVLYVPMPSPIWTGLRVMVEGLEVAVDFRDVVCTRPKAMR